MELLIITSLIVIIILLVVGIFLLLKRKEPESAVMLREQLKDLNLTLDSKLSESSKNAQVQFQASAKIIADVTRQLTKLDQTNRQVVGFADQLRSLQDILKNPKQRGVLGEYYLETVLKNVLPPGSYQTQYSFSDGTVVDAVVFVNKQIIPIDSKFSLENYNRIIETDGEEKKKYEKAFIADLKNRIDETSKYVKPEEKTMDFAFMFVPSEAVYYDLLVNRIGEIKEETNNLLYYAGRKRVIVVSPTSFLAYLQTVLQGLKGQKISEQAREIISSVEKLNRHLGVYSEYMDKVGVHLGTTVASYNKARKELAKVDKDVVKITGNESNLKLTGDDVDKPMTEN